MLTRLQENTYTLKSTLVLWIIITYDIHSWNKYQYLESRAQKRETFDMGPRASKWYSQDSNPGILHYNTPASNH